MCVVIISIRTDKPEAELGLHDGAVDIVIEQWQAHRALAETLHQKIADLCEANNIDIGNITGVAVYKGPGSFTGLRIGMSVANALAASYEVPICAETGEEWRSSAVARLLQGENDGIALPFYGADPHITAPKR